MKISRSSVLVGTFLISTGWMGIATLTGAHAEDKADLQKDHVDTHAKKEKEEVDQQAKKEKDHIDERAQAKKDDIDRQNATPTKTTTATNEVTDTWITTKVKASFFNDKVLKGADIHVDTDHKGVVVLSGYVPTDTARVHAVAVARDTKGVKKVDDKLQLKAAP